MTELSVAMLLGYFLDGLLAILTTETFIALCIGLFMGFWVGILPGVGGPATLAILIPFTFTMDPFPAFALLLGMISVASTAGDMTAILFGIPGESANAATLVDGSPMAKRGEAGRALGASLSASLGGAIVGAFCLAFGIAIIRPLVLSIGYAEFFMLSLAGVAFLATLSSSAVFKGLTAGALGLLLSAVGMSRVTGVERFTFDSLFLWGGIGFIPAILGLFAIPELIDMASGRSRLAGQSGRISGAWQGVRDTFRHFGIMFRCSILATYIGLIPGMGASIAQWVAYGHAAQSAKDKHMVGRGAVECVIGPGAANNATMSGSLIPTIGFGVPGSPQMAILLGAFIVQGLVPGPAMLTPESSGGHLTLTFSMVWMIILSNVIVVGISFLLLNQIAKVAYVDVNYLVPFILVLVFVGGFANQNDLLDLWVCLGFGILGWIMVRLDWPRPPLILGLVLGALIENNLFLTLQAYGASWITFPSVILIFSMILATLLWPLIKSRLPKRADKRPEVAGPAQAAPSGEEIRPPPLTGDLVLSGFFVILFGTAIFMASQWRFSAALMPVTMASIGLACAMAQLTICAVRLRRAEEPADLLHWSGFVDDQRAAPLIGASYLLLFGMIYLFGFAIAAGIFVAGFLVIVGRLGKFQALALGTLGAAAIHYGFWQLLRMPFPRGWASEVIVPIFRGLF